MSNRTATISLLIATMMGLAIAMAGIEHGQTYMDIPLSFICVGLVFGLNWLLFFIAYWRQTEVFFDLAGGISFLSVVGTACFLSEKTDARSMLLAGLIASWAIRLGTFLFTRILREGKDQRFDEIKPNFIRFLNAWTIQAIWVSLTVSPALFAITSVNQKPIGILAVIGIILWLLGFHIEVIADYQKSQFRKNPENQNRFIQTGLWARSRHPNYFGEIMLWFGITLIAIPVLQGYQWMALISPFFVILLLTRVSGIPMLEQKADAKWGGQEDYEAYKARTPILIPKLW